MEIYREPITSVIRNGHREAEQAALQKIVSQVFGEGTRVSHRPDGSPYIEGRPDIFISISHCSDECVLAVNDSPIGIDIETLRPQLQRISHKFLTASEQLRGQHDLISLLKFWTAKEAVFKCYLEKADEEPLVISEIEISTDFSYAIARKKRFELSITFDSTKALAIAIPVK